MSSVRLCVGVLALCCASTFLAGCRGLWGHEDYYEVPTEKLRQIKPLELDPATAEQEPQPTDVNEVAPAELELTLEQCRALALQNNLDLKAQLLNPTIATEGVRVEEAKFEAAFFGNISLSETQRQTIDELSRITGTTEEVRAADLGVQVPLRTGGTVTFDLADSRTSSDAFLALANPYYGSNLNLSVSQPLLRNAGRWANTHSIRLARYDHQITDARAKLEVIRVIAALDRVYWRLGAARKELEVRQQQYDLAQTQLEQAGRFVKAGQRAPVEVLRAEAGVAQQLEAIIIAENNLRDRERDMKRIINKTGLDMQTRTVLRPVTEPDPLHYQLDRRLLVEAAAENRMEMLELELQIAQDTSTLEYMRNQTLPLLTLDYTYNVSGAGATRDDSYDLLLDNMFNNQRVGLQLLVPLGNEAAKSRLRRAFFQRHQRLATRRNRRALIEQEVLNAIDQVEANWQRILASRQNAILAGRLYEAERRQFNLGLRTSTDVLDAQTSFADAQSAEIAALTEYQIALVDLAYATGTLLGAAKIEWEPIVPDVG